MVTPGKHLGDWSACWPLVNVQNPLQLQRTHCFSVIWKSFAFAFSTTKITHTNNREKNLLFRDILENIARMNKKIWHKNKTPSAHLAPKLQEILNFHKNQIIATLGILEFNVGLFFSKLSVKGSTKQIKLTQSFLRNRNNMHLFEGFCVNVHGVNHSPSGLFHKTQTLN